MLLLSRILPKRLNTALIAARTTRKQAQQSDDFGGVAIVLAMVAALWTYRSEQRKREATGRERRVTLREVLGE